MHSLYQHQDKDEQTQNLLDIIVNKVRGIKCIDIINTAVTLADNLVYSNGIYVGLEERIKGITKKYRGNHVVLKSAEYNNKYCSYILTKLQKRMDLDKFNNKIIENNTKIVCM